MTTMPQFPHDAFDDRDESEVHAAEQAAEIARLTAKVAELRGLYESSLKLRDEYFNEWRARGEQIEELTAEMQSERQKFDAYAFSANRDLSAWRTEALEGRALIKDRDTINASLRAELAQLRREMSDLREEQARALDASLAVRHG